MTKKHEEDLRRGRKLPYTSAEIAVVENELLRLDSRLMRCEMKPKAIYAPNKEEKELVDKYTVASRGSWKVQDSWNREVTNKRVREKREKIGGM